MTICFYSFCQMQNTEPESITKEPSSEEIISLEKVMPAKEDSLSLIELQQLNMQLREVNVQLADYRNDIAKMCHRRQSSLIQETLGAVLIGGALGGGPKFLYLAGAGLCVTGLITWVCSYTPIAKSKVKVTPEGVVYRF